MHTRARKQFGQAIADFQSVQHQLARRRRDRSRDAGRYNAARLREAGRPFLTEAAMCKILSSEVAERVASLAVNLFGGYGFVKDYSGRKTLPRRQDRPDLRRDLESATANNLAAFAILGYATLADYHSSPHKSTNRRNERNGSRYSGGLAQ